METETVKFCRESTQFFLLSAALSVRVRNCRPFSSCFGQNNSQLSLDYLMDLS